MGGTPQARPTLAANPSCEDQDIFHRPPMPLSPLVRQLQQVPLTGEVVERSLRPDRLRLSGAGRGARALISSALARSAGLPCW